MAPLPPLPANPSLRSLGTSSTAHPSLHSATPTPRATLDLLSWGAPLPADARKVPGSSGPGAHGSIPGQAHHARLLLLRGAPEAEALGTPRAFTGSSSCGAPREGAGCTQGGTRGACASLGAPGAFPGSSSCAIPIRVSSSLRWCHGPELPRPQSTPRALPGNSPCAPLGTPRAFPGNSPCAPLGTPRAFSGNSPNDLPDRSARRSQQSSELPGRERGKKQRRPKQRGPGLTEAEAEAGVGTRTRIWAKAEAQAEPEAQAGTEAQAGAGSAPEARAWGAAAGETVRVLVCTGDVMGNIHAANLVREIWREHRGARAQGQWEGGVADKGHADGAPGEGGCAGGARRGAQIGGSGLAADDVVEDVAADVATYELEVYAIAGRMVESAGASLVACTDGISSIGIFEALPLLAPAARVLESARKLLESHRPPHVVILVDYPGINMQVGSMARKILRQNVQLHYFIPPNEWLFWPWRAKRVASLCDSIICTYPEEAQQYRAAASELRYPPGVPPEGAPRAADESPEDVPRAAAVPSGGTPGVAQVVLNGHPLADCCRRIPAREEARRLLGIPGGASARVVALVPASRQQELRLVWPVLLGAAEGMLASWRHEQGPEQAQEQGQAGACQLYFVIPVAQPGFLDELMEQCRGSSIARSAVLCPVHQGPTHADQGQSESGKEGPGSSHRGFAPRGSQGNGRVLFSESDEGYSDRSREGSAYEDREGPVVVSVPSSLHALAAADVAGTKSGSVTLELALLGVPQVVVYRLSAATAFLARSLFRFRPQYVSLVNLMLGRLAVPELIQEKAEPAAVAAVTMGLLQAVIAMDHAAGGAQKRDGVVEGKEGQARHKGGQREIREGEVKAIHRQMEDCVDEGPCEGSTLQLHLGREVSHTQNGEQEQSGGYNPRQQIESEVSRIENRSKEQCDMSGLRQQLDAMEELRDALGGGREAYRPAAQHILRWMQGIVRS